MHIHTVTRIHAQTHAVHTVTSIHTQTVTRHCFSGSFGASLDSVRVVQLYCVDGKLLWKHPEGALMLRIHPPLTNGMTWTVCLRAAPGHGSTAIFRRGTTLTDLRILAFLAAMSVSDNDSLAVLVKPSEADPDMEICFQSLDTVNIYLQTTPGSSPDLAGFYYSVKPDQPSSLRSGQSEG